MLNVHFSVVVPLYNKAEHIVRTLASLQVQSFQPLEIVVVNDGSTDQGADLVAALGDSRIKIVNQPNGGVARARNTGIAHAQGNWIAFLDADDWLHPDYLQILAQLILTHPQLDLVATQYKSMPYEAGVTLQPWPVDIDSAAVELIQDLPQRWMRGTSFFTSSVAVRASRLQALQPCFPPGESFGEDLDLWFRLAETSAIALSTAPLVGRVLVPGSLSVVHVARTEPPFLLRMAERARSPRMAPALRRSSLQLVNYHRLTLARAAISAGDRLLARQLLWRARQSLFSQRWWFTAIMATLLPGSLVYRWQHWRKLRKVALG